MIKNSLRQVAHHLKKFVFTERKNPPPATHTAMADDEPAEGGRTRSQRRRKIGTKALKSPLYLATQP